MLLNLCGEPVGGDGECVGDDIGGLPCETQYKRCLITINILSHSFHSHSLLPVLRGIY